MLQMSYDDPYSVIDLALSLAVLIRAQFKQLVDPKKDGRTMTLGLLCFAGLGESSFHDFRALCLAEVKSARCVINVAGPYMLTQGELM